MIPVKTEKEVKIMEKGGRILVKIMKELMKNIKPGICTEDLNQLAEKLIYKYKVLSSFKGFKGFPANLCISVNEELVHGLPSKERILKKGDIVTLDLGIEYKGYHTDMAITVGVGKITPQAKKLIKVTKKALKAALKKVKPGKTIGDISSAIQKYVEARGFSLNQQLTGHGIGKEAHEPPLIPNVGQPNSGPKLISGMTLCLEPMVNIGTPKVKTLSDGWTVVTVDKNLSCHFEYTVLVTKKGYKILTKI